MPAQCADDLISDALHIPSWLVKKKHSRYIFCFVGLQHCRVIDILSLATVVPCQRRELARGARFVSLGCLFEGVVDM